jgi:uncharacterized SAM-binding protein YcdF (DUF218 family)
MGKLLLWVVLAAFYLFSTPLISRHLIAQVETYPALIPDEVGNHGAGAIVILSAGRETDAKEYGGDTVGKNTLQRSRYGAFLARKTGLPLLVSGGFTLDKEGASLAQVMAKLLREDFQVGEAWLEDKSTTTKENAVYSTKILLEKNIDTAYLVTQAAHMPRSVAAFEKAGLKVIPAPTAFESGEGNSLLFFDLLPSPKAMKRSSSALHEIVGAVWYSIRY